MLSLFGYDTKGDYYRITQEMIGRRVNVAVPEQSLLLLKATGKVPHTGGQLFTPDSPYYQTLYRWIAAGAPMIRTRYPCRSRSRSQPERMVFHAAQENRADEGHGPLFGRLDARRDRPGTVRVEQSFDGDDRQARPGDGRPAWRHVCIRPLQPLHDRLGSHRAAGRRRITSGRTRRRTTTSTSWSTIGCRSCICSPRNWPTTRRFCGASIST